MFSSNSDGDSPFHCAVHSNSPALVEYLVNVCAQKTNIDIKDELNKQNLHQVCFPVSRFLSYT